MRYRLGSKNFSEVVTTRSPFSRSMYTTGEKEDWTRPLSKNESSTYVGNKPKMANQHGLGDQFAESAKRPAGALWGSLRHDLALREKPPEFES